MVDLIPLFQTPEDSNSVLYGRLADHHRLEAPFQRRIFFDILPVLVQGGGPDAVQLAPGQQGFEEVARIHGALGLACPHDGVQFVDEEDNPPFRLLHLIEDRFQPLLKLPPVLGPGDKGPHIQRENGLIPQGDRDVPLHNPLGQTFGDGGFAHAWFSDENGVVFGLSGENTDDVADLVIAADDRVHLIVPGALHQIRAVLFQGVVGLLRVVGGHPLAPTHLGQGLHDGFFVQAVGAKQLL